jgi:hypothetical protein
MFRSEEVQDGQVFTLCRPAHLLLTSVPCSNSQKNTAVLDISVAKKWSLCPCWTDANNATKNQCAHDALDYEMPF